MNQHYVAYKYQIHQYTIQLSLGLVTDYIEKMADKENTPTKSNKSEKIKKIKPERKITCFRCLRTRPYRGGFRVFYLF